MSSRNRDPEGLSAEFGAVEAFEIFNKSRDTEKGVAPAFLEGRNMEYLIWQAVKDGLDSRADNKQPFEHIDVYTATQALQVTLDQALTSEWLNLSL